MRISVPREHKRDSVTVVVYGTLFLNELCYTIITHFKGKSMRFFLTILVVLALSGIFTACNKTENNQAAAVKIEQKSIVTSQMNDAELAVAFLNGIQNGDKKRIYEVSNLTPELVENSRKILTNTTKYKQTKKERVETEHALRMSGSIDFFLKKLPKVLPKSTQLLVSKTTKENTADSTLKIHHIKVVYSNRDEALSDKTLQKMKEMTIRLQQIDHVVNGRLLHEFSFKSEDFEKIADGNFEVTSYY